MKVDEMIPEQVEKLIEQREAVRKMRNYAEADKIRLDIEKLGYRLEDKGGRTRAIKIWLVDTASVVVISLWSGGCIEPPGRDDIESTGW